GEKGTVRMEWQGASEVTAAQLLVVANSESVGERSALEEAEAFLIDLLSKGPVSSKQAIRDARDVGLSEKTLQRARAMLGVEASKHGYQGGWCWSLPGVDGSRSSSNTSQESEELLLHVQSER
ncbi:MAG: hypothetical protein ACREN8_09980, partial [Candidatus Dormibacteraceae bacterium]